MGKARGSGCIGVQAGAAAWNLTALHKPEPPLRQGSCYRIGQIIRILHTTKQLLNQSQSVADVCYALDVEARVNKPLTAPALRASPCDLAEITDPTVVQLPITSEHPKSQILATGALNR